MSAAYEGHYAAYRWTANALGHRGSKPGWKAPVPVLCCGAATIGGAGKTTVVQDLARRIVGAHVLIRGYGAYSNSLRTVRMEDSYAAVGDEALLHACIAPTWRCDDRELSARFACHAGAEVLLLDDGLQNRSLTSTVSLLVVDGASGFGNGRVVPFGPLREPIIDTVQRATAAVVIGADRWGVASMLERSLPVFLAETRQIFPTSGRRDESYLAFSGIAYPQKFFEALRTAGLAPLATRCFPNHYPFDVRDLRNLERWGRREKVPMITTPKDGVRVPARSPHLDVKIANIGLAWKNYDAFQGLLARRNIFLRDERQ